MRRDGPRAVAFALDALEDALEPPTVLAKVQRVWPRVAGTFGSTCTPVSERAGVVTVACESSVLAQQLDLMSELVIANVNAALGSPVVKRLRPQATRP